MLICSLLKIAIYTGLCIHSEQSCVQGGPEPPGLLERSWRDPGKVTLERKKSGFVALWLALPLASSREISLIYVLFSKDLLMISFGIKCFCCFLVAVVVQV